jgi:transcription elongation factor Elf1
MKIFSLCIAFLLLGGCGSGNDEEETIGKEMADDYNQAMDEAAAVEDQLKEQKEQMDKAIEEPE